MVQQTDRPGNQPSVTPDRYQLAARCVWQERRIAELERELRQSEERLAVLERYADARIATLVGGPAATPRPVASDPLRASERWQMATDTMPRVVGQ